MEREYKERMESGKKVVPESIPEQIEVKVPDEPPKKEAVLKTEPK